MRWKQNLAFNNDDETDDENYVQIFTKKANFPTLSTSYFSVPMSLSEIEIK